MSRAEDIKQQAVRLMADKGFEAMSLRQLATAVGLRPGSVYTHYLSKGQLLLDLHSDYLEDLLCAWQDQRRRLQRARRRSAEQLMYGFIRVYVSFHYARPAESSIVRLDFRSLDEQGKAQVNELKGQYAAELDAILRLGVQAGVFQLDDVVAARLAILSLLQGLCAADTLNEARALDLSLFAVSRLAGVSAGFASRGAGRFVENDDLVREARR